MDRWTLKRSLRYLHVLFYCIGALAALCAFIFAPWSLFLILLHNGSAIGGYQQAGTYFVVSHGKSAQVSPGVFLRMLFIERAAIVSALTAAAIVIPSLLISKSFSWRTRSHAT
jgi:hypothetical protein